MAKKLLIADDDPVVRTILSAVLESLGFAVDSVTSGASCLSYLNAASAANDLPDALFLDLLLQDMTGLEVLSALRSSEPALKELTVIMLSANSSQEVAELTVDQAPDWFLEKPFTAAKVEALLREELKLI